MMFVKKALLHIGKHKTGTTSFQNYVSDHREQMLKHGVIFVPMGISNFIAASIIRDQLPIPPLKYILESGATPSIEKAHALLKNFVTDKNFETLLISCEHFSYFRQEVEINKLKDLLIMATGIKPSETSVCVVFRQPEQFLVSYTNQIMISGHDRSREKKSPYYCESDSWLLDDNAIKILWKSNFRQFKVLQYEAGDPVIQICKVMGLPIIDNIKKYYHNKRKRGIKIRIWFKRNLPEPIWKILKSVNRG